MLASLSKHTLQILSSWKSLSLASMEAGGAENILKSDISNLHYTRGITPKRITSGWVHLRGLAPGQQSYEATLQRQRAVGDTVPI